MRPTKKAVQRKYWTTPAIADSMKRSERDSLATYFAICAATSAAAIATSGPRLPASTASSETPNETFEGLDVKYAIAPSAS